MEKGQVNQSGDRIHGGIVLEAFTLRVRSSYKQLGTLVTSTGCPTADAARRVSKTYTAYNQLSGHFLSSAECDLKVRLRSATAIVDATLLHNCGVWTELASTAASRAEAVHTMA